MNLRQSEFVYESSVSTPMVSGRNRGCGTRPLPRAHRDAAAIRNCTTNGPFLKDLRLRLEVRVKRYIALRI